MGEDTEDKGEKKEEESTEEISAKEKSEKEDDKEDEEPEIKLVGEEEPSLEDELNIQAPPRRQDILKAYPDLFKKFPQLEKAYYRDAQFVEILPTLDDAKEALRKSEQFDKFESKVLEGDISDVLKVAKESDEDAFKKLVDNYLPSLHKIDPNAHFNIMSNVFKNAVANMFQEGTRLNNDDLKGAAVILNQFMFGTSNFAPPTPYGKGEMSEAEAKLQEREQKILQQTFERHNEELNGRVDNILKATINEFIDPKETMTQYVKKQAIRDALEATQSLLEEDTKFRETLDGLWKKAFDSNFSKKSLDAIKSAYLAKARTIMPDVIKKTRAEALKDGNRAPANKNNKYEPPASHGRAATSNRTSRTPEASKGKMSTLDFLMQD